MKTSTNKFILMPISIFFFHLDALVQYIAHLLPSKSVSPFLGAEPAAAPRKKAGKMQPGDAFIDAAAQVPELIGTKS